MANGGQHVVPSANGWSVRRAGTTRASSTHRTQEEAVSAARTLAKNQRTELYIHGLDGRIRERNSYGTDPVTPKG
jgi:hypothetical protein